MVPVTVVSVLVTRKRSVPEIVTLTLVAVSEYRPVVALELDLGLGVPTAVPRRVRPGLIWDQPLQNHLVLKQF